MAITLEGSTTTNYAGVNGFTVTFSTSPVENDVILVWAASTSTGTFNGGALPSGWDNCLGGATTLLIPSDTSLAGFLIRHTVTAGEDAANTVAWALTTIWQNAETGDVAALYFRGVDTTTPIDAFGTFTEATTPTSNTLPAVASGDVSSAGVVLRGIVKDGTSTFTTPGSHTQRATSNTNQGIWLGTRDTDASVGVAVASQAITSSAADEYVSFTVVLTPAATGTPETVDETDDIGITDSASLVLDAALTQTDPVGITDTVERARDVVDSYTDNVGLTDSAVDALDVVDSYTDNVGITDSAVDALDVVDSYTDNVGITDSADVVASTLVEETDDIGITDAALAALDSAQAATDNVGILDSIATVHTIIDEYTNNVGITDTVVLVHGEGVEIQENVGITDTVVRAVNNVLSFTDNVGIDDTAVDSSGLIRSVTDTLGITDSASTLDEVAVNVLNICLEFGTPTFVARSAGVQMVDRAAGVDAVDRSADAVMLDRETGVAMVDRGVAGAELVDRLAGVQTIDRDADVTIRDRTPGTPVLEC